MTALVLGTAQFGAGYGVTNAVGRLSDDAVGAITDRAVERGVLLFDTAANYADAESRLGAALAGHDRASVITKFAFPEQGEVTEDDIVGHARRALGGARLRAILLHRVADLSDPRWGAAREILRAARADGVVEQIGVSIYDADDLDLARSAFPDLDLLQIPGNVVDRRLLDSAEVAELHRDGVEVHVRSLFLQGILLADPLSVDARFSALVPHLTTLRQVAEAAGVPLPELLVQQVRDHPVADALVVGATTLDELDEIVDAFEGSERDRVELAALPIELIDPRRW